MTPHCVTGQVPKLRTGRAARGATATIVPQMASRPWGGAAELHPQVTVGVLSLYRHRPVGQRRPGRKDVFCRQHLVPWVLSFLRDGTRESLEATHGDLRFRELSSEGIWLDASRAPVCPWENTCPCWSASVTAPLLLKQGMGRKQSFLRTEVPLRCGPCARVLGRSEVPVWRASCVNAAVSENPVPFGVRRWPTGPRAAPVSTQPRQRRSCVQREKW